MAWKVYPNEVWGPLYRGGDGPYKDGRPSEYVTEHQVASLPFWDWIENEDGSWFWLGRGANGRDGPGPKFKP